MVRDLMIEGEIAVRWSVGRYRHDFGNLSRTEGFVGFKSVGGVKTKCPVVIVGEKNVE
jgi:hypothetical protein